MTSDRRAPGLLGVHVLGPGYGESVILEFPDKTVGVIDVFREPQGAVPVIDFLEKHFDRPTVRFIAVTHPHADHCVGLSDLVDRYRAEEFFVFDTFQDASLFSFLKALWKHGSRDVVEKALDLPTGATSLELLRFDKHLRDRGRPKLRLLRS